jgi:cytochrome c biogenesis protein CcmG/thiol:disulfide interchange protein DsbE
VLTAVAVGGLLAVTIALAAALRTTGTDSAGGSASDPALRVAPPLSGATLSGGTADLTRMRGRVVVLTVWASWCPPCRDELPVLSRTVRSYSGGGIAFLGILTRDTPTAARSLLTQSGSGDLVNLLDPDGSMAVTLGATGVPETYVVDRDGTIRARHIGPVTEQWLRQQLDPLVDR